MADTKRHRRPSVRLGEIGDHHPNGRFSATKTRQLAKLSGGSHHHHRDQTLDLIDSSLDDSRTKRNRRNWIPRTDEFGGLRSPGDSPGSMEGESEADREGGRQEEGVGIWLSGLGLGKYVPVFEIHEVDEEVLPFLTLEDLKEMGIAAVGSRRKMLRAIERLGEGFS